MNSESNHQPIPFVDLQTQSKRLKEDVLRRIGDVIDGARYILGSEVEEFEDRFAGYCGVKHCVGMANGTEALHMALRALEIGNGDEVITAGNSFAATPLAIMYSGATPVFVDVDPTDFNLNPDLIESAISPRTKAIMPVHLYGQPARMREICEIAQRHGLRVIEDAAQAHGAEIDGQRCGSFGDIGCFSFYPGKNLGAFGDAGATVTSDPKLSEKLGMLRNYGQKKKNQHDALGFNCRLDTVQACVLLAKLDHIETWTQQRRTVADWYREELAAKDVVLPSARPNVRHVYHLFVARTPNRDALIQALAEKKISAGIHYPTSLASAKPFACAPTFPTGTPICRQLADEIISLPMFPEMTREQVRRVSSAVTEFASGRINEHVS